MLDLRRFPLRSYLLLQVFNLFFEAYLVCLAICRVSCWSVYCILWLNESHCSGGNSVSAKLEDEQNLWMDSGTLQGGLIRSAGLQHCQLLLEFLTGLAHGRNVKARWGGTLPRDQSAARSIARCSPTVQTHVSVDAMVFKVYLDACQVFWHLYFVWMQSILAIFEAWGNPTPASFVGLWSSIFHLKPSWIILEQTKPSADKISNNGLRPWQLSMKICGSLVGSHSGEQFQTGSDQSERAIMMKMNHKKEKVGKAYCMSVPRIDHGSLMIFVWCRTQLDCWELCP